MTSVRRAQRDLMQAQKAELPEIASIEADEDNLLLWTGLLTPNEAPYSKGAFKFTLEFPSNYPFRPPKLVFVTPIRHPNIDENGLICLPILKDDTWKPTFKIVDVLTTLCDVIHNPDLSSPLDDDIAAKFQKDKKAWSKAIEEHIKKHGEKRPKK